MVTTTEVDPNKEKSSEISMMLKAASGLQKIQHAEQKHQQDLQQKEDKATLEVVRSQETFGLNNAAEARLAQIDIESKEQKKELDLAAQVAKGIVPPSTQDPVVPPKPEEVDPFQKGMAKLFDEKIEEQKKFAQNPVQGDELGNYMKQQMLSYLKLMDEQKNLANSPFGLGGKLLGNVLNIIPGQLGTQIFGGQKTPEQKLEILNKALYAVSPLIRTEMNELLGGRKLDMYEKTNRGVSRTVANMLPDEESHAFSQRTQADLESRLSNDPATKDAWAPNTTNNLSTIFHAHRGFMKAEEDLANAGPTDDLQALNTYAQKRKSEFLSAMISRFKDGMTLDDFNQQVIAADSTITGSGYLDPLKLEPGMSKDLMNASNAQFLTAAQWRKSLVAFEADARAIGMELEDTKKEIGAPTSQSKPMSFGRKMYGLMYGNLPGLSGNARREQLAQEARAQPPKEDRNILTRKSPEDMAEVLKPAKLVQVAHTGDMKEFKMKLKDGKFTNGQLTNIKRMLQDNMPLDKALTFMRVIDEQIGSMEPIK